MRLADIASSYTGDIIDSATGAASGKFRFKGLPKKQLCCVLGEIVLQKRGERFPNRLTGRRSSSPILPIPYAEGDHPDFCWGQSLPSYSTDAQTIGCKRWTSSVARQGAGSLPAISSVQICWRSRRRKNARICSSSGGIQECSPHSAESTSRLYVALLALQWAKAERITSARLSFVGGVTKWGTSAGWSLVKDLCLLSDPQRPIWWVTLCPMRAFLCSPGMYRGDPQTFGTKLTLLDFGPLVSCPKETATPSSPLVRVPWARIPNHRICTGVRPQTLGESHSEGQHPTVASRFPSSGWRTPFLSSLRLTTIPANLLLDAQGKILVKTSTVKNCAVLWRLIWSKGKLSLFHTIGSFQMGKPVSITVPFPESELDTSAFFHDYIIRS